MSDLVWWTLFAVLTLILVVITGKLIFRIINDVFCDNREGLSEESRDLEDLTRYRTDFRTIFKDAECVDESEKFMITKQFVHPKTQVDGARARPDNHSLTEPHHVDGDEDNKVEQTTADVTSPDLDNLTDEERQIMEKILGIEGEVQIYAKEIPFCLGGRSHVQFFELNQNFIMSLIQLSGIDCNRNEKLKKRQQVVSVYIQNCQNQLKKKADEDVF